MTNYDFSVYFLDELVTDVHMNLDANEISMSKYVFGPKQPFMANRCDIIYAYNFLKSRCFEDGRPDLHNILNYHEMTSNDPYEWCKKTHGVMSKDFWWIRFSNENINWNDINPRNTCTQNPILSSAGIRYDNGSSDGTQIKYCERRRWFKQDLNGYEGEAEHIIACLLACSDVNNYVFYKQCLIDGKTGCVSEDFLRDTESFISFESLHQQYVGQSLLDKIMEYQNFQEKYNYLRTFIHKCTDIDITSYLSQVFSLDALVLNDDRHFNNLGMIYDYSQNRYHEAPIFDNGAGLLSNIVKYSQWDTLERNIGNVFGQPLYARLDLQAYYAGFGLRLDYDMFMRRYLSRMKPSRAVKVMCHQLEQCRSFIPNFKKEEIGY